jgi:hypothetical protein
MTFDPFYGTTPSDAPDQTQGAPSDATPTSPSNVASPSAPSSDGGFDPFYGTTSSQWAPPPEPLPPIPPPLGWGDVGHSFMQGLQSAGTGLKQSTESVTGQTPEAPEPTSPAAAPYEWSDLLPSHWGDAVSKLAYRAAASSPTLAGAGVGALAGSEVGPIGTLGGSAIGAGALSAYQTLGPAYYHNLKENPSDPKGAWDKAVDDAVVSGAVSGVAFRLLPVSFLKNGLFNIGVQAGIIQPGVAAAGQVARNAIEGRHPLEGVKEAAVEAGVGTAVPLAGARFARGIASRVGLPPPATTPAAEPLTAEQFDAKTDELYGNVRNLGVEYTNPQELYGLRDQIKSDFKNRGLDPRIDPQLFAAADLLGESRSGPNATIDFTDVDNARKAFGNIWQRALKSGDDSTRAGASLARNVINEWLGDPQRQQNAGVNAATAMALKPAIDLAREYSRAARGMHSWNTMQAIAERAPDPEKALRAAMNAVVKKNLGQNKGVLNEKGSDYPIEALRMMSEASKQSVWNGIKQFPFMRLFNPHSPMSVLIDLMAHSIEAIPGGAAIPIGLQGLNYLSEHMANARRAQAQENITNTIGRWPSDMAKPSPPLTRAQRTQQNYSPFVYPITSQPEQQPPYARGGRSPDLDHALTLVRRHRADGGEVFVPQHRTKRALTVAGRT